MNRIETGVGLLAGLCIGTAVISAPEAFSAQDIKLEVSLQSTISDGVPRVLRYGGNIWWIPKVFSLGVAEKILAVSPPGMARICLGNQVLQHAESLDDLRRRLERYALNDFLREYTTRARAAGSSSFSTACRTG